MNLQTNSLYVDTKHRWSTGVWVSQAVLILKWWVNVSHSQTSQLLLSFPTQKMNHKIVYVEETFEIIMSHR